LVVIFNVKSKGIKMRTLFLVLITLFNVSLLAEECELKFTGTPYCATLEWTKGPLLNDTSAFTLTILDETTMMPISPKEEIDIYSWMIMYHGHNHGGPLFGFTEVEEGVFKVDEARFFMGGMRGHWEIRVDLKEGDTLISQIISKVPLK
jgi:hypothetical protein